MKINKKVLSITLLLILLISCFNCVYADEYDKNLIEGPEPSGNTQYNDVKESVNGVVGIIIVLVQVASLFGIIYAGVRYMFGGASKKAELKNSLIAIVIGCIIVFGGATAIGFIADTISESKTSAEQYVQTP